MPWTVSSPIVVPIDFSGESRRAIATALQIAERPEDVHLVHIMLPLDYVSPGVLWGEITDENRETAVREKLNEMIVDCDCAGVQSHVAIGNPGLEIAEYAAEIVAGLIVIPSHGYHGVKRLLLGSVAERVLRHASCSVLTLRRSDAE